jgi:hypothetical protein
MRARDPLGHERLGGVGTDVFGGAAGEGMRGCVADIAARVTFGLTARR